MTYQLFAKGLNGDGLVVLGQSTNLKVIIKLEQEIVSALGRLLFPSPETCEIGIRRCFEDRGWNYSQVIGYGPNLQQFWVEWEGGEKTEIQF